MPAPHAFVLEPVALLDAFVDYPPLGFNTRRDRDGTLLFAAPFDLPTTADARLRRRVHALPGHARWRALLCIRDPEGHSAASAAVACAGQPRRSTLTRAAEQAGYVLLQGQALAHVSVDFPSIEHGCRAFQANAATASAASSGSALYSMSKPGLWAAAAGGGAPSRTSRIARSMRKARSTSTNRPRASSIPCSAMPHCPDSYSSTSAASSAGSCASCMAAC